MSNSSDRGERVSLRELLVQGIFLVLLLACVFPGTFLRGEVIVPGGFLFELPPWEHYKPEGYEVPKNWLVRENLQETGKFYFVTQGALDEGQWPLWNPVDFSGVPALANYQSAVFYPPRLLHSIFDGYTATTLFILLKLWLCGFTAYLYGRFMRLGWVASCFLSVGWMLGSYNLIWCYWPEPDVLAWLPIVLIAVELLLDGRYRRGFFGLCFGATLLLIAGQPENAFAAGLGTGLYFFLRLGLQRRWGRRLWMPVALAGAAWGVALLACAVQILPLAEYMANSHTYVVRVKHFLTPGAHLVLWVARYFGTTAEDTFWGNFEQANATYLGMVYPGVVVWIGVFLLASRGGGKREWLRIGCMAVAGLFSFLMAFDLRPLYPIQELPLFDSMWRCYYINFAKFALPFLAAVGLRRWFSQPRKLKELVLPGVLLLVVVVYVSAQFALSRGLLETMKLDGYVWKQLLIAGVLVGLGAALIVLYCFWPRPRVLGTSLALLLAFDLIFSVRGLLPTTPRELMFVDTALTDYLREQPQPCRVGIVSSTSIYSCLMYPYGIEDHWGHDGIYPERIVTFYGRMGTAIWNATEPVCSIRLYLRDPRETCGFPYDDTTRFRLAETLDGIEVYENLRAFPRAFLVGDVEVIEDEDALFERMASPEYDPGRVVVAEWGPEGTSAQADAGELGNARVTERTYNRVVVDLEATADCYLVLADAFFPGWKAFVDGEPADIFPAYYAFRGVAIPKGAQEVVFVYKPLSFYLGLWVSVVVLVSGAIVALVVLRRGKCRCSKRVSEGAGTRS